MPKPPQTRSRELASHKQLARATQRTKNLLLIWHEKEHPRPSKSCSSDTQSSLHFLARFSTPRTLRAVPTHFLLMPSPPSPGKSSPSLGLCPRAPRAGEPGPRLTRPYGPLLGPPSTPCVARLASAHALRGLLPPAHTGCALCTLPSAVTSPADSDPANAPRHLRHGYPLALYPHAP